MKIDKQLFMILVFGLILIFSVFGVYYFFQKEKDSHIEGKFAICIAKKDIEKNKKILANNTEEKFVSKSSGLAPLACSSVIGKYTKSDIVTNEMFVSEKLSSTPFLPSDLNISEFKHNSLNLPFKMFQNPNYTLKKGDKINIITVAQNDQSNDFAVNLVAKNVDILGFIWNGKKVDDVFSVQKFRTIVNKKDVEKTEEVKADELLVDIKNETFLNLLNEYSKSQGLWMLKTSQNNTDIEEVVKQSKIIYVQKIKASQTKEEYYLYEPATKIETKTAMIKYNDKKEQQTVSDKKEIAIGNLCADKTNVVLVTQNGATLFEKNDLNSKALRMVKKNSVLSFKRKINDWYEICDGTFINENFVKVINFTDIESNIKK